MAASAAGSLHWLPCSIAYSGPAEVHKWFVAEPAGERPKTAASLLQCPPKPELGSAGQSVEGVPLLQATYRGRRLRGEAQSKLTWPKSNEHSACSM